MKHSTGPSPLAEQLLVRVPEHCPSPATQDAHVALIQRAMAAGDESALPSRQQTSRRRARIAGRASLIVSVAAVIAGGAGLAAAYVAVQAPTQTDTVRCFAVATTDYESDELGIDAAVAGGEGGTSADAAIDLCAAEWAMGALSETPPYLAPAVPGGVPAPVPDLAACVLPSGGVGVFPGSVDVCLSLGLPAASTT